MKIKIILGLHTLPVKCVLRKSEISNSPTPPHPPKIMPACIGVLQGRAATELWKLQQWSSETHLHSWPLGGVNAIRHSWFPTQQENTQRYNWWRLPFIKILVKEEQWYQVVSLFLFSHGFSNTGGDAGYAADLEQLQSSGQRQDEANAVEGHVWHSCQMEEVRTIDSYSLNMFFSPLLSQTCQWFCAAWLNKMSE